MPNLTEPPGPAKRVARERVNGGVAVPSRCTTGTVGDVDGDVNGNADGKPASPIAKGWFAPVLGGCGYKLTLEAQWRVAESRLGKREIIRRLGTSASPFYRILDQTDYSKSVDQVLCLLSVLDCRIQFVVHAKRAWRLKGGTDGITRIPASRTGSVSTNGTLSNRTPYSKVLAMDLTLWRQVMLGREELVALLSDWNYWDRPIPASLLGYPRRLSQRILGSASGPEAVAVVGLRRCGKTTILRQVAAGLLAGGVDARQVLFVNLEDHRFGLELGTDLLDRLLRAYHEEVAPQAPAHVFLDEVQAVPGWERWVRTRLDLRPQDRIYVSGSSSTLMASELSTLLTGRCLVHAAHPFSYPEYLGYLGVDAGPGGTALEIARRNRKEEALYQYHLGNYMNQGGLPRAVATSDAAARRQLLQQYFDDILAKDIVFRHEVRNTSLLRDLALVLLNNVSNLMSFARLARTLGTSPSAVQSLVSHVEESLMLHTARFFSHSVKESLSAQKPRKLYAEDTGLRNAVAAGATPDVGRLAENVVFNYLTSLGTTPRYWSDHTEVDFVTDPINPAPINVCFSDEIPARELAAIGAFAAKFGSQRALLVTRSTLDTRTLGSCRVDLIPLWALLLADPPWSP